MRGDPNDAKAWLAFARRDLTWARRDLEDLEHLRAAVALQQAAEKCLKAKLIELGWELKRVHALSQLLGRLQARGVDLQWFAGTAEQLSYEYFAERCPATSTHRPPRRKCAVSSPMSRTSSHNCSQSPPREA
jgi:HEPN domain-containing protein